METAGLLLSCSLPSWSSSGSWPSSAAGPWGCWEVSGCFSGQAKSSFSKASIASLSLQFFILLWSRRIWLKWVAKRLKNKIMNPLSGFNKTRHTWCWFLSLSISLREHSHLQSWSCFPSPSWKLPAASSLSEVTAWGWSRLVESETSWRENRIFYIP